MSYKCLHDDLDASDRHAALSDFAYRVWTIALAKSDCRGRILAAAQYLANHLSPFRPFDVAKVEAAILEISGTGLGHLYEAGGKRYLVFHKAQRSCGTGMGRKSLSKCPAPPPGLCECCSGSFQQKDGSATTSATCSAISSPLLSVPTPAVSGPVENPAAGESPGSRETPEEPPPATFSTDREALHLAQRWRGVNGKDSRSLSSLEKASQAFAMTIKAGVDPHAIEAAIQANPGRSPLEIRDLVLPRAGPARASPPAVTGERKTVRWTPPPPEPEEHRANATATPSP